MPKSDKLLGRCALIRPLLLLLLQSPTFKMADSGTVSARVSGSSTHQIGRTLSEYGKGMAWSKVLNHMYIIAIDISDLNEVIALLERHHYSKTSYHRLGLRLNLSYSTLEKIKKDSGEVDPCFTECLASWLRKADDVETPTIDTLIAALRGIGENAVADGIDEERKSE